MCSTDVISVRIQEYIYYLTYIEGAIHDQIIVQGLCQNFSNRPDTTAVAEVVADGVVGL
jgi:hypothetical protein